LIGQHLGHRYRLGDQVKIQVLSVDVEERKIDFVLAGLSKEAADAMRRELGRQKKTKSGIATGKLRNDTTGRQAHEGSKKSRSRHHSRNKKNKDQKAAELPKKQAGGLSQLVPDGTGAEGQTKKKKNNRRRRRRRDRKHGKTSENRSREPQSKA
ncbi:MAG: ribonuclease R, partial [Acidaminococcus sp.]|nr:ribonuclease R [Acidaminococcus sp.]